MGTPFNARATSTRRWWGVRTSAIARSQRGQELPLLDLGVGLETGASEGAPRVRLERQLPSLPRAPPQLDGRLEQGELVHPGGETAGAAEVVEALKHAHEGVVGRLESDVVELVAAQVGQPRSTPADLEARRAEQEPVQPREGLVLDQAVRAQRAQPLARLLVEVTYRCGQVR